MTTHETERQLRRLFAETAPERAPEQLRDAIRVGTAGVRQRPAWLVTNGLGPRVHGPVTAGSPDARSAGRTSPPNRLVFVAATALLGAAIVGGALLNVGRTNVPGPTPTPTSSQAPPAASPASSPTPEAAAPAAPAIAGNWLADAGALPEIGHEGGRLDLLISPGPAVLVAIRRSDGLYALQSDSLAAPPGEIRVRATGVLGCDRGEEGRYTYERSLDGMFLTVVRVADACRLRASILATTWVRSHGLVSDGGRGVLNAFTPAIVVELPTGPWTAPADLTLGSPQAVQLDGPDGASLIVVKNPSGLSDPCRPKNPSGELVTFAIDPTIDTFSRYLATLPGFAIESQEGVVAGYPARHLAVSTSGGTGCPSGEVAAYAANDTLHAHWSVRSGDAESIWLTQVDGDLYLLAYRGVRPEEETRLLSTIEFIRTLPTP